MRFRSILFFICMTGWCYSGHAQKTFRFITYNILQGMRRDSLVGKPQFVSWVKKMDPDVLALQEVTGFTQETLESLAISYGHPYAVLLTEGIKYPVAVSSKYPITNVRKVFDNMDRGFILSDIAGYRTAVVHLTPFDYRKRRQEAALMLAEIGNRGGTNWVLMGDFNTVSPSDAAAYQDGRLVAAYRRYESKYAPILKLDHGQLDYQVIRQFLDSGYTDVLRLKQDKFIKTVHPRAFQPRNSKDIASRIDFIFVDEALKSRVHRSVVIKDQFTDYYSDHYPVCLEILQTAK